MGAAHERSEVGRGTAAFEPRDLALEFRGTAGEYFRVWAVNVCLTIVTLGIFSAWAKVRKKRYWYSSIAIDGTPLQYLGRPVPILKGRLIAVALFAAYYACSHFAPAKMPWLMVAVGVVAPWIVARASAFNARFSAYRNVTFRFDAGYWAAFKALYAVPALVVAAIGVAMVTPDTVQRRMGIVLTTFALAAILYPWWVAGIKRFLVGRTSFGGVEAQLGADPIRFYGIYLAAAGMTLVWALVVGSTVGVLSFLRLGLTASTVVMAAVGYLTYGFFFAFVQARTTNLVWSTTRLGPVRFESRLRARDLFWIYLSNIVVAVLSAGLLVPWAVVRTLKYRIGRTRVWLDGGLGAFAGAPDATVTAVGAEVGDLFDMDVSL